MTPLVREMTSLEVIFGCAWFPGVIIIIGVAYYWWTHRKYTKFNSRMPDISDVQNGDDG